VSLTSRLHAWNQYQKRAMTAQRLGYDPETARLVGELIAERIRASAEPCPYPVHAPDCGRCAAARQADRDVAIALAAGELR
jgi:hypothetical protein